MKVYEHLRLVATMETTWDSDIKLIREVEKRGILYDNKRKDFKKTEAKEVTWENVAITVGVPGKYTIFICLRGGHESKFQRSGNLFHFIAYAIKKLWWQNL